MSEQIEQVAMNNVMWETALNEHFMPVTSPDGKELAVAFMVNHEMQFYLPVENVEQQFKVVMTFRNIFTEVFNRFVELNNMMNTYKQVLPSKRPKEKS